jgi:hypothetical protein
MKQHHWTNENTWRVALQIKNTPELYQLAQRCHKAGTYLEFLSITQLDLLAGSVPWYDESLNVVELNELVHDIRRGER